MNNNDKIKRSIVESIIVISIMALYIVYGIHFLPLLMLIIPLPFVILGVRNGIYSNIISIILTSLIVGVLLGITSGASLILVFAPFSLAINYCIKSRKNTRDTILISTAAFFLSSLVLISLGGKISNLDLAKQFEQILTQFLTIQVDMLKEMGMTNYEVLQTADLLERTYKNIIVLIPSLMIIFSLALSYINIFFSSIVLKRMGYGVVISQRFSRFKLPNNILPGIGTMFLATFLARKLEIQYHEALLLNITFLTGFLFLLQGLSVLDFLLIKIKMKLVFRILLLAMNIIFIPMSSILFFIGVLDTIFDMRRIRKQKSL